MFQLSFQRWFPNRIPTGTNLTISIAQPLCSPILHTSYVAAGRLGATAAQFTNRRACRTAIAAAPAPAADRPKAAISAATAATATARKLDEPTESRSNSVLQRLPTAELVPIPRFFVWGASAVGGSSFSLAGSGARS